MIRRREDSTAPLECVESAATGGMRTARRAGLMAETTVTPIPTTRPTMTVRPSASRERMARTALARRDRTPKILAKALAGRPPAEARSEVPAWRPDNPRNKSRRARDERTPSTAACRNCGNTLPRPHLDGRHSSWILPSVVTTSWKKSSWKKGAGEKGHSGQRRSRSDDCGQKLLITVDSRGTILLIWSAGHAAVGATRSLIWRCCRDGVLVGSGNFVVLAQPRLNFVHHAKVAYEFRAPCEHQMCLAIGVARDGGGLQIRELRMPPGKSRGAGDYKERGGKRQRAVRKARHTNPAQPSEEPWSGHSSLARSQCLIQNRVDQPRRRLRARDGGDGRRAQRHHRYAPRTGTLAD